MGILNYSSYVHKMEIGLRRNGMHPMAVLLLNSIVTYPSVKNRWGKPYKISRTEARDWYHGAQSIPQGIRDGADNSAVVRGIKQYFEDNVVPEIYSDKEQDVLDGIMELIKDDKNIQKTTRKKLEKLYYDGKTAEFLSVSFLLAIKNENGLFLRPVKKKKTKPLAETADIEEFENLMKQRYKKPDPMTPPKELAEHELTYATELLSAYADAAKVKEMVREDLLAPGYARFSRDFDRQRRFYYMAETILEASKDMLKLKEAECFDKAKGEVFDYIIQTCDSPYDNGYKRLCAVIERAGGTPFSKVIDDMLLNWMGPGEKQGICHMLVNDKQIRWVDDENI